VKPDFVSGAPSLEGATLVVSVYTPKASNFIKTPVSIDIRGINDVLKGNWSGTWSGQSFGRHNAGEPAPSTAVNGTWLLNLSAIDLPNGKASGSLTWNGEDAYWTYTVNGAGTITQATPHTFTPNRTIQLTDANTKLTTLPGNCGKVHLSVDGAYNAPNPSDQFYGPSFSVDINLYLKTVESQGVGFTAHPYNSTNFDTGLSSGTLTGSKQ